MLNIPNMFSSSKINLRLSQYKLLPFLDSDIGSKEIFKLINKLILLFVNIMRPFIPKLAQDIIKIFNLLFKLFDRRIIILILDLFGPFMYEA